MTITILSIFLALLAVANVSAVFYFERRRLGFAWDIYSRIRWHMLPMTIGAIGDDPLAASSAGVP